MFAFEFMPDSLYKDRQILSSMLKLANKKLKKHNLKSEFVIIPASPKGESSTDSILAATLLQRHFNIPIVPTISAFGEVFQAKNLAKLKEILDSFKSNFILSNSDIEFLDNCLPKWLQAKILSLNYANIKCVALISGDSESKGELSISGAILSLIIKSKYPHIQIINALSLNPTLQTIRQKLATKPTYLITQPIFNAQQLGSILLLDSLKNIEIFICFFPIFSPTLAKNINAKNLGIHIPQSYIDSIKSNAIKANKALFKELLDSASHIYLSTPIYNDLNAFECL